MRAAVPALACALLAGGCVESHASVVDAGGIDAGELDSGSDLGPDYGPSIDCGPYTPLDAAPDDPECPVRAMVPPCTGGPAGFVFDGTRCVEATMCSDFPTLDQCAFHCATAGRCATALIRDFRAPSFMPPLRICTGPVCGGTPEICVDSAATSTPAALTAIIPMATCAGASTRSMSRCAADQSSCIFPLETEPVMHRTVVDAATWMELCATSLLPGVSLIGCEPPLAP